MRIIPGLLLLATVSTAFAANATEESIIQQLNEWELDTFKNEHDGDKSIREAYQSMDRAATPRAWLHAYTLNNKSGNREEFFKNIDNAIQQAVDWNDQALLYRLVTWKVAYLKTVGAPEREFRQAFGRMEKTCPEDSASVWCGRFYDQWAFYFYDTNELAQALRQSQRAITILGRVKGPDSFYLHDAQTTLSNLFGANPQTLDQAIKLTLENYAWFDQNGFHTQAAVEATNLNVLLRTKNGNDAIKESLQWLDKAEFHTKATGTINGMANINLSRSRIMIRLERYQEAIQFAEQARAIFEQNHNFDFVALSELNIARSLIKLKRLGEAKTTLDRAEKVVPATYREQHLMILQVRIDIAEAEGQLDKAYPLLKTFHKKWEEVKEEESTQGMNRLNAELGLKLEEERSERLLQENELQKQKVKEAEVFRIFSFVLGLLAMSTLGFLIFALRQTKRVKQSHNKMQRILDNIDEGLMTIDRSCKITDDYSKKLPEILGTTQSLDGQGLMQTIFAPSDLRGEEQSMIHEILEATFNEDRIAWDLNSENLCREIHYSSRQDQVIELRWIPIFDSHNRLERILLSLIDTTEKKALEKAFGQQKRYLQALPDTLKEMLIGERQHIARLLDATQETLEKLGHENVDASLLRSLHTQKGTARTLGLKALSHDLHDLETILQPKTGQSLGQKVDTHLKAIQDRLGEYRAIAEVLQNNQQTVTADQDSLAHILYAHIPSWREHMKSAGQPLHKISLVDGVMQWTAAELPMLEQICIHAVNNCLDHGFLEADTPIDRPEIEIITQIASGRIQLDVRDNGQGLNLEQLGQLAIKRGFVPKANESVADVVFCDGFSLAKKLSMSSGRGVGLAAVKELIEARGGEVHLLNREDAKGSVLRASWPLAEAVQRAS